MRRWLGFLRQRRATCRPDRTNPAVIAAVVPPINLPGPALSALGASLTPAERTPGGFVGQPVCSEELFAQREVPLVGCCQVAAGAKFRTDELGKRCHIRLA